MNRNNSGFIFLFAAFSAGFLRGQEDANEPVNLLRLPSVKIVRTSDLAGDQARLSALADDNPSTVAGIKAPGGTVDIVYGFDGALVTPERLEVQLPESTTPENSTARVEVLVSTVSMQAGFQSLRADPLKPTAEPQAFAFTPTGARWIMIRLTAMAEFEDVAVAEVRLFGHEGPPVSRYAFNESPAQAFDVLERLKKTSAVNVSITSDEADLFADVREGKFNKWSFGEAALIVSGITDAEKRKEYVNRLDALEIQARSAVAGATTPFETGEKLLAWMHSAEGPLAKGYSAHQTDLSVILDTGTFNCVSSATLFNILGRRLGLDVRAVEVPDHAFSILYDGTRHADIETTNASGFDPARDPAVQESIMNETGFRYIPDSHRDQRREVGEAGLAAIICYNHGVTLSAEGRHHEALLAYFRAMALDREFDSAVKNALAALAGWSSGLADDGKFEEAREVLVVGLDLAPKDATLLHNRKVLWSQWADAAAMSNKDDEAIEILRRAAAEVPDGNFPAMQAWIYIRRGEELIKAGEWEKAMAAVETGLGKIDETPREELRAWMADLPLRWSQSEMDAKNYANAIELLARARSQQPDDQRLTQNIIYVTQEWVRETFEKEGEAKACEVLALLLQRFPEIATLNKVAVGHVQRIVGLLSDAGNFEESLAAIERHQQFLVEKETAEDLYQSVYDSWATSFTDQKNYEQAVVVYERGLGRFPDNAHLKQNIVYTMQEWAKNVYASEGAEKALEVFLDLQKRFPDMNEIDQLAKSHVQRVIGSLLDADKFPDAIEAIAAHKALLDGQDDARNLALTVYDAWADGFLEKQEWQSAIDIYAKGLGQYPADSHLSNNAVAIWNTWASTFIDKKEWDAAIKIYEKALLQFPNHGTLKNNCDYCREQLKK